MTKRRFVMKTLRHVHGTASRRHSSFSPPSPMMPSSTVRLPVTHPTCKKTLRLGVVKLNARASAEKPSIELKEKEITMAKAPQAQSEHEQLPTYTEFTPEQMAKLEKAANKGLSKDAADNLVPLVYILQKMSPQVEERDPRYIPGAK